MNYNLVSYKSDENTINLRFNTYEDARNAWMDLDRLIIVGKNYMMGILSMTKPTNPRDGFYDFSIEFLNRYDCMLFFARNIRCYNGQFCLRIPEITIREENNDNIDKVIKDVQFNPKKGAVTILWENGDVTVAKKGPGDKWDPEKGLMMAFGQHFFGSKTQFNNWRKKVLKDAGMDESKEPDISYVDSTTYEPKHVKKGDQLLDMFDPQTGHVYKMSPEFIKEFTGFADFCKNIVSKSFNNDEDDTDVDAGK